MEEPDEVIDARGALEAATDPLEAVAASRALRTALERWERRLVAEASDEGRSWEAIGRSLGLSRQAAWERYRATETPGRRLDGARERQRAQLAEARRLRAAAREAEGAEREALARRAREVRAAALAALEEGRRRKGER